MRSTRIAAAAAAIALPLLLAGCIVSPPAAPVASDPAPTQPSAAPTVSEPATSQPAPSQPAPSTPTTSDPAAPTGDGDFELVLDGEPVEAEWISTVECFYSDGFGAVSTASDSETEYFSVLISEEGGELAGYVVFANDGLALLDTGENASISVSDSGVLTGSAEMTSNFSDSYTLEYTGTCS